MFGRRNKPVKQPPRAAPEDEAVRLAMSEVYELSYAAFQARGFPDAGIAFSAGNICWLETRNLPGLIPLIAEFTQPNRPMWNKRSPQPNAQRQMVFDCPFITGTLIGDYADQLIHPNPEEIKGIQGPTSPILLLPRVAEQAARRGHPVEMYFKAGDPPTFGAKITTDGDRVFAEGDVRAMLFGHGVSLSRAAGPMPDQAIGAVRDEININASWLASLADFISREETDERPV